MDLLMGELIYQNFIGYRKIGGIVYFQHIDYNQDLYLIWCTWLSKFGQGISQQSRLCALRYTNNLSGKIKRDLGAKGKKKNKKTLYERPWRSWGFVPYFLGSQNNQKWAQRFNRTFLIFCQCSPLERFILPTNWPIESILPLLCF